MAGRGHQGITAGQGAIQLSDTLLAFETIDAEHKADANMKSHFGAPPTAAFLRHACRGEIRADFALTALDEADIIIVSLDTTGGRRGFCCVKKNYPKEGYLYVDLICSAPGPPRGGPAVGLQQRNPEERWAMLESGRSLLQALKDYCTDARWRGIFLRAVSNVITYYYYLGWRFIANCGDVQKDNVGYDQRQLKIAVDDPNKSEEIDALAKKYFSRYGDFAWYKGITGAELAEGKAEAQDDHDNLGPDEFKSHTPPSEMLMAHDVPDQGYLMLWCPGDPEGVYAASSDANYNPSGLDSAATSGKGKGGGATSGAGGGATSGGRRHRRSKRGKRRKNTKKKRRKRNHHSLLFSRRRRGRRRTRRRRGGGPDRDNLLALQEFYRKYSPRRIDRAKSALKQYKCSEDALEFMMDAKYGKNTKGWVVPKLQKTFINCPASTGGSRRRRKTRRRRSRRRKARRRRKTRIKRGGEGEEWANNNNIGRIVQLTPAGIEYYRNLIKTTKAATKELRAAAPGPEAPPPPPPAYGDSPERADELSRQLARAEEAREAADRAEMVSHYFVDATTDPSTWRGYNLGTLRDPAVLPLLRLARDGVGLKVNWFNVEPAGEERGSYHTVYARFIDQQARESAPWKMASIDFIKPEKKPKSATKKGGAKS